MSTMHLPFPCLIPLTKGQFAMVDAEDYAHLMRYKWQAHWNKPTQSYYANRMELCADGKRRSVAMHRQILGLERGNPLDADHIHGNTLDNRKSELRTATRIQNSQNQKTSKNNTSGCKGIYWRKRTQRWEAGIKVNGVSLYLGSSKIKEVAVSLRKAAEAKYFGEFARVA